MSVKTRDVQDGDLEHIVNRMRLADRAELLANHKDPLEALRMSVEASLWARVLVTEKTEQVLCVFGLGELEGTLGIPWMIGTVDIKDHRKDFMRASHSVVETMADGYARLTNLTDARNKAAHKWLRKLGFTIITHPPLASKQGFPFYMFYKDQDVHT